MGENTRRGVFATLLALALLSAVGLMLSSLVTDSAWRAVLQVTALVGAVGLGGVCAVLAWRWWVGRYT